MKHEGTTWSQLTGLAERLPGVEKGTSYGTPALKVCGKLMARLKEDGETAVLRVDLDERDALIELDPRVFFVTDHYRAYPWVLVRLVEVRLDPLHELVEQAWRRSAPARLVAGQARRTQRK